MVDKNSFLQEIEDSPWAPLQDRKSQRSIKRNAVLKTAARMFLQHGLHRVSMNDIARRLNITKPALYNYFESKNDIVLECFRLGNALAMGVLEAVEAEQVSGLIKLRTFMSEYAVMATVDFGACIICFDDRELSEKGRQEVLKYKRAIDRKVRNIISAGIADGSIIQCDVKLITFAIFGALNTIGQWYDKNGEISPRQIGDEFAQLMTKTLDRANAKQICNPVQNGPQREQG